MCIPLKYAMCKNNMQNGQESIMLSCLFSLSLQSEFEILQLISKNKANEENFYFIDDGFSDM